MPGGPQGGREPSPVRVSYSPWDLWGIPNNIISTFNGHFELRFDVKSAKAEMIQNFCEDLQRPSLESGISGCRKNPELWNVAGQVYSKTKLWISHR